jgi:hypothetical protein
MRPVPPYPLWLGHAGDGRDLRGLLRAGVRALVDLALEEPPAPLVRELVYCRFPIIDGSGNPFWLLRAAVQTTAGLIRARVPTLVCCGAGMSRSPSLVAVALAMIEGRPPEEVLVRLLPTGKGDVSPGLWQERTQALLTVS